MAIARSSSTPNAAARGVQSLPIPDAAAAPPRLRPQVEIRPSTRRRKTAAAFYEGDRIVVLVPARLSASERADTADRLVNRLLNRKTRSFGSDDDLEKRAAAVASRYLPDAKPKSIRWVTNQNRRWGSCSPATGTIRISSRLQIVPDWVLDSVVLHELAHLIEASHSPRFYELLKSYPRLAEADAYLAGYSLGMMSGGWGSEGTEGCEDSGIDGAGDVDVDVEGCEEDEAAC